MKNIVPMLGLVALVGAPAAFAQVPFPPPPPPQVSGPYVGGLIGYSRAKEGCIGLLSGSNRNCDPRDPAFGVFGGYQLNRYLAGEAGYMNLGKVRSSTETDRQNVHTNILEATAVGFVPITDALSLYGKFGGYRASLTTSEPGVGSHANINFTYGGGLQFDFQNGIGVRAHWQRYKAVGGSATPYGENIYDVLGIVGLYRFR